MENSNMILTVEQMKYCEKKSDEAGVSLEELMDNAGEKLGRKILEVCIKLNCKKAVILAGKGNNGGDGFVAADFLSESGVVPTVILVCGAPSTDLAKNAFNKLHKDIKVLEYDGNENSDWACAIDNSIIADCIFGTGFKGEIRENLNALFSRLANSPKYIIACDIPSGVNADSGQASKLSVCADETITFHRIKLGMLLSPARYLCGKISTVDIGIPEKVSELTKEQFGEAVFEESNEQTIGSYLPKRPKWGHKGTFGRLVSVCGSESYIGAAGISTLAAMRTGVGLVNLCCPQKVIDSLSGGLWECTYTALKTNEDGIIMSDELPKIYEKLKGAGALLIGCGLGHNSETEKLVSSLIEASPLPIILDADGINSIAPNTDILLKAKAPVILTPHPAELARLCGVTTAEILSHRHKYAHELANKYNVTVVSKGAETIICQGGITNIVRAGNTALSKGGSGDMLAGIISSLTAQAPEKLFENCIAGCYIMGKAAEKLSETKSERSIIARDIINEIPAILKGLE